MERWRHVVCDPLLRCAPISLHSDAILGPQPRLTHMLGQSWLMQGRCPLAEMAVKQGGFMLQAHLQRK